jgi:hypothetical protein
MACKSNKPEVDSTKPNRMDTCVFILVVTSFLICEIDNFIENANCEIVSIAVFELFFRVEEVLERFIVEVEIVELITCWGGVFGSETVSAKKGMFIRRSG